MSQWTVDSFVLDASEMGAAKFYDDDAGAINVRGCARRKLY